MTSGRRVASWVFVSAPVLAAAAAVAQPLGQPLFSVTQGGPSALRADFIYANFDGPPVPVGGGMGMGLGLPGDDLDAFTAVAPSDDFVVCVSVDPLTVGLGGPDGPLPPFNVFNQAQRRQHTGDAFIGSEAYNRTGGLLPLPISLGLNQNFLVINQSAPYFRDFALLPAGDPNVAFPAGTPADDVNGLGVMFGGVMLPTYFSVRQGSPSIPTLAGGAGDSGADLYFDPDVNNPGDESLFASRASLGLQLTDDVDGLAVFDLDLNGVFDGNDQILFSLSRGSPTLELLAASPADILSLTFGGAISRFVLHSELGLLFTDDIDAIQLDTLIGNSALATILAHVPAPSGTLLLALAGLVAARRRR